jgi:hypothetical protein
MKRKGQSTLEYVIILTVVVAAIILGAAAIVGNNSGDGGLGKLMKNAGNSLQNSSNQVATIVP